MASTIATLRGEVESMLNLTNTSSEGSDAQIDNYLLLAFIDLCDSLPPVTHTTLTLSDGEPLTVSSTHDRLFFVSLNGMPLFPHEYSSSGNNVVVQTTAAEAGDTLQVWRYVAPTITLGTTTTVDTDCIFGKGWLEGLAVLAAAMSSCQRQASVSDSNSAMDYAANYRVLGERYNTIYTAKQQVWQAWYQGEMAKVNARAQFGPGPRTFNPHGNVINRSQIRGPKWLVSPKSGNQAGE